MKTEQEARVSAVKRLEETEQALVTLSQENAALQLKLEEAQSKLKATDEELTSLKNMITQMLTAILGKSGISFVVLSRLIYLLHRLLY